jgi:putative membrane protein
MDYLNHALLGIHLVALAAGGAATFGIPVIGARIAGANADTRATLFAIVYGISRVARIAMVLLLITGPLLVWLKYGGVAGFNFWFWVKMVLVALLLGLVIAAGINTKRGEAGDPAAPKRGPMIGMASMFTFFLVVAAAVLAFE